MSIAVPRREYLEIELALVDDPALPSRADMDDEKLEALTESIRTVGLQQPIIVARAGERFEVIAGHRRRIACARAGLERVPAIVYATKDASAVLIQAHENARREDLNPADEAIWFVTLLEQHCGDDIEKLCALVGEKLSYVDARLALLKGDPEIFAALKRGEVKIGVAQELNRFTDERYRRHYLECAIRGGATKTTVAGWRQEFEQMFRGNEAHPLTAPASVPGLAEQQQSPFTCIVCGRNDHVHLIRQVDVHSHCKLAILDPLLEAARQQH